MQSSSKTHFAFGTREIFEACADGAPALKKSTEINATDAALAPKKFILILIA
jgi:hypothetical protein